VPPAAAAAEAAAIGAAAEALRRGAGAAVGLAAEPEDHASCSEPVAVFADVERAT
jgi:hypothetical protein